jgi:hypothetical protein
MECQQKPGALRDTVLTAIALGPDKDVVRERSISRARLLSAQRVLTQPKEAKEALLLDRIKFMMVAGDQGDTQTFHQRQCKGIGKGDALCNFYDTNPLDEGIIGVSTEYQRQR